MIKELMFVLGFIFGLALFTANAQTVELFDRYPGKESRNAEIVRLDNFAIALENDPDLIGYVAYFVGSDFGEKWTRKRALSAKQYLVQKRGISSNRIIVARAGTMETTLFVLQPVSKKAKPLKWKIIG
jgi:hypothetical protein